MRLWPYRMISYLPNKHLVSQFRECCGIMSMLKDGKHINNCIVSRIEEYDLNEFYKYCMIVCKEMKNRDFKMSEKSLERLGITTEDLEENNVITDTSAIISKDPLFKDWHNTRYEIQCLYMFQEKYDVKMITFEEYQKLLQFKNDMCIEIDI